MTTQHVKKYVTLSYTLFALVLLATLGLGLLSGGLLGGLVLAIANARASLAASPTDTLDRAWIGMTYVQITPAVTSSYGLTVTKGALVVSVSPNSPAAKAGLLTDDIITAVDGQDIDETTNLMDMIVDKKPGDQLQLRILRNGAPQVISVALGRLPRPNLDPQDRNPIDRLRREVTRLFTGQ